MGLLEKAKEKAGEVAHEAAEATSRAAGATTRAAGAAVSRAQDAETQARVGRGLASARRTARTLVERIDPGVLAEVVVKATALQEKTNARLRTRGSIYRIGELQVTASIPPGISFVILRVDDVPGHGVEGRTSTELLAEEAGASTAGAAESQITSLDPADRAALDEGLLAAGTELDATADALLETADRVPAS